MIEPDIYAAFRPNVGVCLFNRAGQCWLGRRIGDFADLEEPPERYRWQFPQGGIDEGEEPVDAAFRELFEETGVRSATLLAMTPGWLAYEFPAGYRKHKTRKWRGQRQKWAAMIFTGTDDEVNLQAHGEQEFDAWKWVELEEVVEEIVPFKQGVYSEIIESFMPLRDWLRTNSG